jgi:nucleoside phosphorylase
MRPGFAYPGRDQDRLFQADYEHDASLPKCEKCDENREKVRPQRAFNGPDIHYGLIASGSQVIRNGMIRDKLAQERSTLCFEMEAAGFMDHFPCLVRRGICDYTDSHKNKDWQGYASATAAGYAKDLLSVISVDQIYSNPIVTTADRH